jgi:cytochrome P450
MKSSDTAIVQHDPLPEAPYWPSGRLLGHVQMMGEDPLNTLTRAHLEVGELVRIRLGHIPGYFVFNPVDVKSVLVGDADSYAKTTRGYKKLRLMLGNGLVTSEGDFWLRQRRIAQPGFHRDSIAGFGRSMVRATEDLVARWEHAARSGVSVDVAEAMNALTLRIAGETLLSVDVTGGGQVIAKALDIALSRFAEMVSSPLPYPEYWPTPSNYRFWSHFRKMNALVDGIIRERRQSDAQVPDLLGMFMAAEDPETGESMTDRQLRDEVLTMLTAGHETTANALSWTLYLLSKHPEVGRRLEAELDTVLGGRRASFEDLPALQYTAQVVKEAMRLYPPVWMVARQATRETSLGGCRIPKGAYIFVSQWALHRHPKYWDNPEAFDPGRFGPDRPAPDRFAYLPFSRGKRQCIGDRFAEMEAVLVVATLAQHYRFALEPGHRVELEPSVTLRPRTGMRMRITRRPTGGEMKGSDESRTRQAVYVPSAHAR